MQAKYLQGQNMSRPPAPYNPTGNVPNNGVSSGYNTSLNGHGTPPPMNKPPVQRMPPPGGLPANRFPPPMMNVTAPPMMNVPASSQTFVNGPMTSPYNPNSSLASGVPPHSLSSSGSFPGGISSSPAPGMPRSSSANAMNSFSVSQTSSHSNSPIPPVFSAQSSGSMLDQRSVSQPRTDTPPTGMRDFLFTFDFHLCLKAWPNFFFPFVNKALKTALACHAELEIAGGSSRIRNYDAAEALQN